MASCCVLCPRECRVNRFVNDKGFCGAPGHLILSSLFPHHGEEPPLSGVNGSGTVFFSYCTLKCCFCQNYQISHEYEGRPYTTEEFTEQLIHLQEQKCHNINLVTATHFLPWVLRSIRLAAERGLIIPIVYNCGGYERVDVLKILDGIVDIYLPDMKYGSDSEAARYSHAPDYVTVNQHAIREMFRQTGPLRLDSEGIAKRGLCIRHLVLPGNIQSSKEIIGFLTRHFDPDDLTISLMAQYRPLHNADKHEAINRRITREEYEETQSLFLNAGFSGFFQEYEQLDKQYVIDFTKRKSERLS
jgi:putative pyruvate formate lyase activating enzyme